jgi:outer membrane protein OmpA-like peptidoglycan-associated protein
MVTEMLMGDTSIKIWNVEFVGAHDARGIFYSKNTPIPIEEGILLSTGQAISAQGPNKGSGYSTSNRMAGDKDLHFLAQFKTYDATYISFEFKASHDLIRFNYVFASEEYPEYVGSTFNDVFGFFLTDLETGEITNLAVLPGSETPITVNNINHKSHPNFYIENKTGKDAANALIEFDGLTQPLIAFSEVVKGRNYAIKIAIADVGDDAYDSGVFLQGKSFVSEPKEAFYKLNTNYFNAFKSTDVNPELAKIKSNINQTKPSLKSTAPTPSSKKETSKPLESSSQIDSLVVYFDFDQSVPTNTELALLKNKISKLDLKSFKIDVVGHTDQKGTNSYNTVLSLKRAAFISSWINTNYNLTPFKVKGKSFHQLAQGQIDPLSRAKNRRVVIYFYAIKQ